MTDYDYFAIVAIAFAVVLADIAIRLWTNRKR